MLGSAVVLNLLLIFSVVEAAEFTITLDAQDKFNVTWSYDGTSKDDFITFTVSSLLSRSNRIAIILLSYIVTCVMHIFSYQWLSP